jgi:hypothetical protein
MRIIPASQRMISFEIIAVAAISCAFRMGFGWTGWLMFTRQRLVMSMVVYRQDGRLGGAIHASVIITYCTTCNVDSLGLWDC